MFATLRTLLTKWFPPPPPHAEAEPEAPTPLSLDGRGAGGEGESVEDAYPATYLVPYDENLLERARTQWQFGDWESLAKLNRDTLQHHPDRAKLALLAAGHLQTDNPDAARQFICHAQFALRTPNGY